MWSRRKGPGPGPGRPGFTLALTLGGLGQSLFSGLVFPMSILSILRGLAWRPVGFVLVLAFRIRCHSHTEVAALLLPRASAFRHGTGPSAGGKKADDGMPG